MREDSKSDVREDKKSDLGVPIDPAYCLSVPKASPTPLWAWHLLMEFHCWHKPPELPWPPHLPFPIVHDTLQWTTSKPLSQTCSKACHTFTLVVCLQCYSMMLHDSLSVCSRDKLGGPVLQKLDLELRHYSWCDFCQGPKSRDSFYSKAWIWQQEDSVNSKYEFSDMEYRRRRASWTAAFNFAKPLCFPQSWNFVVDFKLRNCEGRLGHRIRFSRELTDIISARSIRGNHHEDPLFLSVCYFTEPLVLDLSFHARLRARRLENAVL